MAVLADPENPRAHQVRAEVFQARRDRETSLMARGIFGYAANESKTRLD